MTLEQLLANPFVLLALGWVAAKWQRDNAGHTKAVQVDTDLLARVKFLEQWVGDHNAIHGCVQSLKATTEGISKNVDRMTRQFDYMMSLMPTRPRRAPFDFPDAKDWVLGSEAPQ